MGVINFQVSSFHFQLKITTSQNVMKYLFTLLGIITFSFSGLSQQNTFLKIDAKGHTSMIRDVVFSSDRKIGAKLMKEKLKIKPRG